MGYYDATHFQTGLENGMYKVACGRHRNRRGGRVGYPRLATTVWTAVDCPLCQRTKVYKAAQAANPRKVEEVPERPPVGTRIEIYRAEAVVIEPDRCFTARDQTRIRWLTGSHPGRLSDVPTARIDKILEEKGND